MKKALFKTLIFMLFMLLIYNCGRYQGYPDEAYERLAITNKKKLSLASKRALERGYWKDGRWYIEFYYSDLKGDLAYEEGVTRRDPSAVLKIGDTYYVWYTKSVGKTYGFATGDTSKKVFPWDKSEIWYATSKDGWYWEEQGRAVGRGPKGSFDDRSVFTPEVMEYNGKYYLVYQAVKAPYTNRCKNVVGMAVAESPDGPWVKLDHPILTPSDDGEWEGEEDNRFLAKKQGSFDSQKVHDPTLIHYRGKFYLYYKGERMGERILIGGREIRWGVAIADRPEGPYKKCEYNPITNSGHEIIIWPYRGGICALLLTDGPERNTIQWAPDGINFEIKAYIKGGPEAAGLVRCLANDENPLDAIKWGLMHKYVTYDYQYIRRFQSYKPNNPYAYWREDSEE